MTQAKQLAHMELFQGFSPEEIETVRAVFTVVNENAGIVIFDQGESAEYLYVVVEGEVLIRFKPDDGPPLTVARVQSEGAIGWSAVLGNPTYTSAAVTQTNSTLLRMRGVDLRALCEEKPQIGSVLLERLAAGISERLRQSHGAVVALIEQGLRTHVKTY
jgi:CRP-like cAMP-binding protein